MLVHLTEEQTDEIEKELADNFIYKEIKSTFMKLYEDKKLTFTPAEICQNAANLIKRYRNDQSIEDYIRTREEFINDCPPKTLDQLAITFIELCLCNNNDLMEIIDKKWK